MTTPTELCERARDNTEKFVRLLNDYFLYLANHGFTEPVPTVVEGMKMLNAVADGTVLLVVNEPVAWVYEFNDPDPQSDIYFCKECPTGWKGRAYPVFATRAEGEKS